MRNLAPAAMIGACGALLAACLSVQTYAPPPIGAPTASVEVRKPAGFGGGDRTSVFVFDNPDCAINTQSGFLAALDVTTPAASTALIATDRRLYLRGLGQISNVSVGLGQGLQQRIAQCADLVSFTPEVGASYRIVHAPTAGGCETTVLDLANQQAPTGFQRHEMSATCRDFTGILED